MAHYDNTARNDYNRSAALALWLGTAAGVTTMALHPTGRDVVHNASLGAANGLVTAVHTLAILGEALVLCGALGIAAKLRARLDLAAGGYVFFVLAGFTVIIAATASGFLAPWAVRGIEGVGVPERTAMFNDLHYTGLINQAFARISVIFTGIAVILWSCAMLITGAFTRRIAWYGIVVGAAILIASGSGYLRLDIHGYGLVVLATGLWQVAVASALWRSNA